MVEGKLYIGTKIIIQDQDGLCDSPQEKRIDYLNREVTIASLWGDNGKVKSGNVSDIDTFFIDEDNEYFEWTPDLISKIIW